MKCAVVLDSWKLPIFKRHLDNAGFEYIERPGLTSGTLTLTVNTPHPGALQETVRSAQRECANRKGRKA